MSAVELSVKRRIVIPGLLLVLIFISASTLFAQKQLVLLKRESVVLRYYPGDDFTYRLKGSRKIESSYVNNLYDTAIITGNDTLRYNEIDGVYFRHPTFGKRVCKLLVIASIGYIFIDVFNESALHGEKLGFNRGDRNMTWVAGLSSPPAFIVNKITRLNRRYHLIMVQKGSPFYLENPKGYNSPFLPD